MKIKANEGCVLWTHRSGDVLYYFDAAVVQDGVVYIESPIVESMRAIVSHPEPVFPRWALGSTVIPLCFVRHGKQPDWWKDRASIEPVKNRNRAPEVTLAPMIVEMSS